MNVVLIAIVFRKFLYILGFVALMWLALSVLLVIRLSPEQEWAITMQNASPLKWVFGLPVLFVLVLPLFSARRVLWHERVKRGVSYQFSDDGIHVETSISKSDLSWAEIRRVIESSSEFLVFTNPNVAFTLPKRCFKSIQNVASLRELFRWHVPRAKLLSD